MEYRRFGKTNKNLSVLTLGGMRFKRVWEDPIDVLPSETIEDCRQILEWSFQYGINHIETASLYKKSENLLGHVLNDLIKKERSSYYLMTKGYPKTADDTKREVEAQLKALKTDYVDFYAWHGMNNMDLYNVAMKKGGPVETLLKLKEEGLIQHIGFSTHATLDVVIKALETDVFEFMNVHYYYFYQRLEAAIKLAQLKDIGVFIISPNDKGGQLFNPTEKLIEACKPLTPIQWNAKFCLRTPAVHTLSFGPTELKHFEENEGIFPATTPLQDDALKAFDRMNALKRLDPYSEYDGYDMEDDPSGINIPEVLRMRHAWKCYDMLGYAKYRYKMFSPTHHWLAGELPSEDKLKLVDTSKIPEGIPLIEMLRECYDAFTPEDKKVFQLNFNINKKASS